MIASSGFQAAFFNFGIGQGLIIFVLAFLLLAPKTRTGAGGDGQRQHHPDPPQSSGPVEVIKQPIFWLMYFMFVIVGAGGLMITANLKPIAADIKVDSVPVTLMGLTMTAITFAATSNT